MQMRMQEAEKNQKVRIMLTTVITTETIKININGYQHFWFHKYL